MENVKKYQWWYIFMGTILMIGEVLVSISVMAEEIATNRLTGTITWSDTEEGKNTNEIDGTTLNAMSQVHKPENVTLSKKVDKNEAKVGDIFDVYNYC